MNKIHGVGDPMFVCFFYLQISPCQFSGLYSCLSKVYKKLYKNTDVLGFTHSFKKLFQRCFYLPAFSLVRRVTSLGLTRKRNLEMIPSNNPPHFVPVTLLTWQQRNFSVMFSQFFCSQSLQFRFGGQLCLSGCMQIVCFRLNSSAKSIQSHTHIHTHTHTYIQVSIYCEMSWCCTLSCIR